MPVNTKLLAVGQTSVTSFELVYTVPAGHTTIVKHVVMCSYQAPPVFGQVAGSVPSGGLYLLLRLDLPLNAPVASSPWLVLPAGYGLHVALTVAGTGASYWVSGTELTGEPDIPTIPTGLSAGQRPS